MRDLAPHILIVDDEAPIRLALTTALTRTYAVWEAATGAEACRILRTHPIAAIVLDVVLGNEDGLELVPRFRALSQAHILIVTGHSTEDLAIEALRAHVSDYFRKPIILHELCATLARLLDNTPSVADPIARACLLLNKQVEQGYNGEELAKQVNLSERHLRRRFREVHGKSPRQYLTEARMQRAATLLRTTYGTVDQVARDVGYANPRLFWRLFKRRFGVPPSVFHQ